MDDFGAPIKELKMALLDLRKPVFAHGHLYVGLSRVREATNIAIFTTKDSLLIGSRLGTAEDGDILLKEKTTVVVA